MVYLVSSAASLLYFYLEPLHADICTFQTVHNNWTIKTDFEQDNSQVGNAKLTFANTQEYADVLSKLSLKRLQYVFAGSSTV